VNSFDPISEPGASPELPPTEPVAPLKIVLEPEPPPPPPIVIEPPKTEVDLLDVLFILLVTAGAFVFVGTIAAVIFMAAHRGQQLDPKAIATNVFFVIPTEFVIYAVILGFMVLLVWTRHRRSLFEAVGWNMPDRRGLMLAAFTGVGLALVSDIGEAVLNRWIPKSLPIAEFFKDRPSALLLAAFAILVAPFMEEMLFRGFLYPTLARWTGPTLSVLITAAFFTGLHGAQLGYSWAALLPIFIVGTTLTIARVATRSVARCVFIHMTYNFVLMAQTFVATHGFRDMQGL
jgi:uncharacterized protein